METNLAVLIDFENIAAGTEKEGLGRFDVDAVLKRVKDKGRVLIARSYADWGRFARFKQSLLMANVIMYELTSHGMNDKNRADIAMVVDALDLAFTKPYIETYVIVSGDSDFTPLALKMRELNKRVIGIGTRSSTSRLLIHACDEFIFYDTIVEGTRNKRRRDRPPSTGGRGNGKRSMKLEDAFDMLTDAIAGLLRESSDIPLASIVKTAMRRNQPDFSESELGFASFGKFLKAAADRGYVTLERDAKAGGFRVDTVDNGDEPAEPAPLRKRTETWQDPYLPKGVERWNDMLINDRLDPLSAPVRKTVLENIEAVIKERNSRNRRVTVQYVQEDVRKRMKKTHPELPAKSIKAVFNALMRSNVLIHSDGTPVRTVSAPFNLDKDADQLNTILVNVYMQALFDQGADLANAELLAELFLGDKTRSRDIEEILAWLQASDVDASLDTLLDVDDDDDDDDDGKDEAPKRTEPKKSPAPKAAAKKPARAMATDIDDFEAALLVDDDDDDDAEDAKPAPKPAPKAAAKPAAQAEAKPEVKDEEAPKPAAKKKAAKKKAPAKKKTTTKKASKKKASDEESTDDAPAAEKKDDDSGDEAPAKKTTRKRKRKKAAADDTTDSES